MFKRVLLCYDGTLVGRRALRHGAELAILLNAQVYVLAAVPSAVDPVLTAGALGFACLVNKQSPGERQLLDESIDWLRDRGVVAEGYIAVGDTVEQIVAHSKRLSIDLIVLGHYPQPSGGYWWSGSKRTSVSERVQCCILVAVEGEAQVLPMVANSTAIRAR